MNMTGKTGTLSYHGKTADVKVENNVLMIIPNYVLKNPPLIHYNPPLRGV